ncbi:MAG TPA: response regulator transcription factor [Terriglobales bacterium]|jgi:DNA-binding NarL/FixJ family response regulator
MSVRILIADDHEIVREGIRTLITRSRPEWKICGEVENGEEAIEAAKKQKPDVIILDITMPKMSGLEAASKIAALDLGIRILIFTMHDSARLHAEAREVAAQGVVLKSQAARDLIRAIDTLLAGGTFFGSETARNPVTGNRTPTSSPESSLRRTKGRLADRGVHLLTLKFCGAKTGRRVRRHSSFSSSNAVGNSVRGRLARA